MATLRKWLDEAGADWGNMSIVAQTCREDDYSPGWGTPESSFKFQLWNITLPDSRLLDQLLDQEFSDGYGAPEAPRFIADDGKFLYFPEQYDGSTSLVKVAKDIDFYMNHKNPNTLPRIIIGNSYAHKHWI
ncbi:hypothetical protein M316_0073 [Nitrincola phage 1M3-16]|uniref:hypothetical protein n=1 Tax=Nitrincola phage 1M3-16 TaxID=1472912 RepID=UPI000444D512|nr:hypothetical protein GJ22_gp079 [Nitrincola phage 1M3-16]AHX01138.1 hypothetical protein M316_0073 [Nitrincola phage 1M3-16]